jgi:predicted transcriptional regulator
MKKGDKVILIEAVIVTGGFGAEYLPKDTKGIFLEETDGMAEIETKYDTFTIPLKSIATAEDAAA